MADLRVNFAGVSFKNPIVVSSIEASDSLNRLRQCIDCGAGGVVTKTITDDPKMMELTRHSKYAILNEKGERIKGKISRDFVFYSRSGYSVKPPREWSSILKESRGYADSKDVRLIGSLGATTIEKWIEIAKMEEEAGVCMLELNFGCPHPSQMKEEWAGMLIGQDPGASAKITESVTQAVKVPVIVKLTPQVNNPVAVARAARDAGASGVTVINRFTGFAVDIEEGKPYLDGPAGIGGPWVKSLTLRWVHSIYSEVGMPIAGTNGIYDWREAVEFIMSGATLMEVGSVLMLKGYKQIDKILKGLEDFMDKKNYRTIESMRGIASKRSLGYEQCYGLPRIRSVIDPDRCNRCYRCVESCFYDALQIGPEGVVSNPAHCIGCELCSSVCPSGAISFEKS